MKVLIVSSRSATVLVIFIVAVLAFCLASVFASMTGQISILPNESESGGVLDNLSAITDDTGSSDNSYGYQDYTDYSSDDYSDDDSSNVETTTDDSSSSSQASSSQQSSSDSGSGSSSQQSSSSSQVETTTDSSSSQQSGSSNVETTVYVE